MKPVENAVPPDSMETEKKSSEGGHFPEGEKHRPIFLMTPVIESPTLATYVDGANVVLKLENLQPTGSFKLRGLSHLCHNAKHAGARTVVCASGGNAGLSVAYAARCLGLGAHIVVPLVSNPRVRNYILDQGATLEISGVNFNEADEKARQIGEESGSTYIHPFDHPYIWDGHGTMITELREQLKGAQPSVIVCCVGGGGLLYGVIKGLDKVGWADVPILAMETPGAATFNKSVKAGHPVELEEIDTIAACLGSLTIIPSLLEEMNTHKIYSELVEDVEVIRACLKFADDHRMLVEPACGASLAAVYSGFVSRYRKEGKIKEEGPVVVIVCGGAGVTLDDLEKWKKDFKLE